MVLLTDANWAEEDGIVRISGYEFADAPPERGEATLLLLVLGAHKGSPQFDGVTQSGQKGRLEPKECVRIEPFLSMGANDLVCQPQAVGPNQLFCAVVPEKEVEVMLVKPVKV